MTATESPDYEPIDLAGHCTGGLELLEGRRRPPTGATSLRGIPFRIGDPEDSARPCFVVLERGRPPVSVPIGRRAARVVVAHRWERRLGPEQDPPPGTVLAEYAFHLKDGTIERVPVRERFEIAAVADDGWDAFGAFLAVGDKGPVLPDRVRGRWEELGSRQCEALVPGLADYFLWVWTHPKPEVPIASIEFRGVRELVLVAGVTLGHASEDPIPTEAARTVRITRLDGLPLREPAVAVDRGEAGFAYRLPGGGIEGYLEDPRRGWGEDVDEASPSAYVRIAAVASATATVTDGETELGRFRWGHLVALPEGEALEHDGIRVQVVERGRSWVHVTVLDEETGRPVPCRVHFRSPEGVPYQPHGHPDHVNSDLGTWHIDVGGDVRLGRSSYAYIDGTCQGWLPRGDVIVDVVRGYEYEPIRRTVRIERGQRHLELRLRRWVHMNDEGWYSGDSHVHFLSGLGALLEQRGEDLNVVNLLQSQWSSLFTNTEEFTGRPLISEDGLYVTWVSQENRQPFLGHMVLWGLSRPVMPWCSDGPNEAELGAWLETTMSSWADRCHEQGGTVVIPHFPQPDGELAALIATGRADAVEMIVQRPLPHAEYYRYLNAGYPLPLVGGTDKMTAEVPVGLYRTYAWLGDEPFSYGAWTRAVRAGRTFLSGGPLLRFSVESATVGQTIRIAGSGTVAVEARAESVLPMACLQIVMNGEVVAETVERPQAGALELRTEVRVEEDSWLAARCGGPAYFDGPSHRGPWERRIFAHTSPIYIACGDDGWSRSDPEQDRRMLALVEGGLERVRRARRYPEDRIDHHHGEADHAAFLERPFLEALERILARMRS
jgi:hypothetical protein